MLRVLNHKKTAQLLDLSEIIPYDLISQEGTEVSYTFITEHNIQYVVRYVSSNDYYFDETSDIGDTEILEFQFAPIDRGIKPLKDLRIAETLAASIKNVLNAKENAILYICDKSDGKQAARSKLFDKWYKNYSWEMVKKYDGKLANPDSLESEYVSLIVNTKNPFADNIVEAFSFVMESEK